MKNGNEPPKTIIVKGQEYAFLRTRAYDPTSIYRGRNSYLRIGPAELVTRELDLQRRLLSQGFPVAEIIDEGELGGRD